MSTLTASHGLTLSKTGLKLIKAYEGFRPVDRILVSGQRVVGYGHRLYDDKPRQITKADAEALLISDLRAYEDMINENVYAPLTQGQFDALVSFSFNIGPKAFLASETLHALNNGRPLEAANALDVWRKSTINGKTYIVDALMRRRTAEKALFLRTEHYLRSAPGIDLPPVRDEALARLSADEDTPIFDRKEASGIVATAPFTEEEVEQEDFASEDYALKQSQFALDDREQDVELEIEVKQNRRRDDGPAGILMLSEVAEAPSIKGPALDDLSDVNAVDETVIADEKTDLVISSGEIDPAKESSPWVEDTKPEEQEELPALTDTVEAEELPTSFNTGEANMLSANRSVIAEAAADISERLDALIEDAKGNKSDMDWPEDSIANTEPDSAQENLLAEIASEENSITKDEGAETAENEEVLILSPKDLINETEEVLGEVGIISDDLDDRLEGNLEKTEILDEAIFKETLNYAAEDDAAAFVEEEAPRLSSLPEVRKADIIIDNLAEDDAMREKDDEMSIFYERHNPAQPSENETNLGFWLIMLSGFILLGVTLAISLRGAEALMGAWGPLVVIAGVLVGALMVIGAAYYAIRHALSYN